VTTLTVYSSAVVHKVYIMINYGKYGKRFVLFEVIRWKEWPRTNTTEQMRRTCFESRYQMCLHLHSWMCIRKFQSSNVRLCVPGLQMIGICWKAINMKYY